jgi:hypothetical protein
VQQMAFPCCEEAACRATPASPKVDKSLKLFKSV